MEMESSVTNHNPTSNHENQNQTLDDRISNQPDEILCHILSKLPTKSAIGTAILATRWKNLFPQIPNLEIILNDSDFLNQPDISVERRNDKFARFVYNLITTLHEVPRVQKFDLCLEHKYDNNDVNALLSAVLRMNLSVLRVSFRIDHMGLDSFFLSETLKEIHWSQLNFRNVLSESFLPKLKNMVLVSVTFFRGGLLERAISACPLLDKLAIFNCKIKEHVNVLHIESSTVKKLMLINISDCCNGAIYDVVLNMPALESIIHFDHLPETYHVNNLNSILYAHIDIQPSDKQMEDYDIVEMRHKMQNVNVFVEAFSSVSSLFLSSNTVMSLAFSSIPLPTFPNLMILELCQIDYMGWGLLPKFLDCAPNLQVLTFKGGFTDCQECYIRFQNNVSERTLTLNLTRIAFEEFNGEEDELQLVEYFLRCTKSLAQIEFLFSSSLSSESIRGTKSKLWTLRNLSKKSEVDFAFKTENDLPITG